jgi:hypothetical protein
MVKGAAERIIRRGFPLGSAPVTVVRFSQQMVSHCSGLERRAFIPLASSGSGNAARLGDNAQNGLQAARGIAVTFLLASPSDRIRS